MGGSDQESTHLSTNYFFFGINSTGDRAIEIRRKKFDTSDLNASNKSLNTTDNQIVIDTGF